MDFSFRMDTDLGWKQSVGLGNLQTQKVQQLKIEVSLKFKSVIIRN